MHAYIITSGSIRDRSQVLKDILHAQGIQPASVCTINLQEQSIGIDDIRLLQRQLLLMPQTNCRNAALIHDSHLLTVPAQHALLKLLEEPPPRTILLLETPTLSALLPTILSRCHIVTAKPSHTEAHADHEAMLRTVTSYLHQPLHARLGVSQEKSVSKDAALTWIDQATTALHTHLVSKTTQTNSVQTHHELTLGRTFACIRHLLRAKTYILANVHPTRALDDVFLNFG